MTTSSPPCITIFHTPVLNPLRHVDTAVSADTLLKVDWLPQFFNPFSADPPRRFQPLATRKTSLRPLPSSTGHESRINLCKPHPLKSKLPPGTCAAASPCGTSATVRINGWWKRFPSVEASEKGRRAQCQLQPRTAARAHADTPE